MNCIVTISALAALGAVSVPGAAFAQTASDLVGTWMLVSNINIRPDGSRIDLLGPRGTGITIFDTHGRYATMSINRDVPKFASNNRVQGTAAENKAAVEGGLAHFGTYTYDPATKTINYKIEASTYPNWTGTEQTRTIVTFTGDDLKFTAPAGSTGGTGEVGFKRVK